MGKAQGRSNQSSSLWATEPTSSGFCRFRFRFRSLSRSLGFGRVRESGALAVAAGPVALADAGAQQPAAAVAGATVPADGRLGFSDQIGSSEPGGGHAMAPRPSLSAGVESRPMASQTARRMSCVP